MINKFNLHVHQSVLNLFGSESIESVSNRLLGAVDIGNSDASLVKSNKLSEFETKNSGTVLVKIVVARGREVDGVTLAVPRPLAGSVTDCNECKRVGFRDLKAREVCTTCNGIGYLENLPEL